jgi:hypothetical protein
MNLEERLLYHQIHPLKVAIDLSAAVVMLYLLWQRAVLGALIVMVGPTMVASTVLVRWANLEPLKESPLGQYVRRYMTAPVRLARSGGLAVMVAGAWYHQPWVLAAGASIIGAAWLSGLLIPGPKE